MKRRAKKRMVWQAGGAQAMGAGLKALLRPMIEGIEASRQGLLDLFHAAGVEALRRQLASEVEAMVGPKRRRNPERRAYRWGQVPSEYVLGGRKVALPRPRVRHRNGGEVTLPSVQAFQDEDPFTERVIEQALVGVSQRGYARSLEPLSSDPQSYEIRRHPPLRVSRSFPASFLPLVVVVSTIATATGSSSPTPTATRPASSTTSGIS